MTKNLLLKKKIISDFVDNKKLFEEDSAGKINFSINEVTKQWNRIEIDYPYSFLPPRSLLHSALRTFAQLFWSVLLSQLFS